MITQPRHIVPPLNIMARVTMPKVRNMLPVQNSIRRLRTSTLIRPIQKANSRNSYKKARFIPGLLI